MSWVVGSLLFWAVAWAVNAQLSKRSERWVRFFVPTLFGITVLVLWEGMVRGFGINPVLLPAPSAIGSTLVGRKRFGLIRYAMALMNGNVDMIAGQQLNGHLIRCFSVRHTHQRRLSSCGRSCAGSKS